MFQRPQSAVCKADNSSGVGILVGGLERGLLTNRILWEPLARSVRQFDGAAELIMYLKMADSSTNTDWQTNTNSASGTGSPSAHKQALEALRPVTLDLDHRVNTTSMMQAHLHSKCGNKQGHGLSLASLGYFETLYRLWLLVERREKERGVRFDSLMFLRPDLVHLLPMGARCQYDSAAIYHSAGADCHWSAPWPGPCHHMSGLDFWFLGPRPYFEFMAELLLRLLHTCNSYWASDGANWQWHPEGIIDHHHAHPWPPNNSEPMRFMLHAHSWRVVASPTAFLGAAILWRTHGRPRALQGIGQLAELDPQHLMDILYPASASKWASAIENTARSVGATYAGPHRYSDR
uniref:Uncharacterized protein n=1 Tax=Haptolina ericina TaxID=156174 RepID=A0A7S3ETI8_9EUKA|mmetsp:Transcript_17201/g.38571  ORF Transcript_17201/g.38571 Transcript_17201/m.38571 type:complete len:348 (+) Transcript_17201:43-1086(+)